MYDAMSVMSPLLEIGLMLWRAALAIGGAVNGGAVILQALCQANIIHFHGAGHKSSSTRDRFEICPLFLGFAAQEFGVLLRSIDRARQGAAPIRTRALMI